jgi:hypothetical protein
MKQVERPDIDRAAGQVGAAWRAGDDLVLICLRQELRQGWHLNRFGLDWQFLAYRRRLGTGWLDVPQRNVFIKHGRQRKFLLHVRVR